MKGMPRVGVSPPGETLRAACCRYEAALVEGDREVLDALFWNDEATVRFGINDRQRGHTAISQWRASQRPLIGRRLVETDIVEFGDDAAVATTLFYYPGRPFEGRQSQTWIRFGEGWRIVSAHVSEVALSAVVDNSPTVTDG